MATMENDIKFGRCRCCLKVGNHNSFSAPDRKVEYRETFLACFNLVLSTSDKLPDLICTSCVQELNDALTFRSKVVESEQLLLSETSRDTNDLSTEVECGLHSELNIKLESEELIKYELSMDCDNDSDIDSKALIPEPSPIVIKTDDEICHSSAADVKPGQTKVNVPIVLQAATLGGPSLAQPSTPSLVVGNTDNGSRVIVPTNNPSDSALGAPFIFKQGSNTPATLLQVHCCLTDLLLALRQKRPKVKISDEIKKRAIEIGRPCPDLKMEYRRRDGFKKKFHKGLYEKYPWLTGSCKLEKLFCFPCLLSSPGNSAWTTGFTDINNLSNATKKHKMTERHLRNVLEFAKFERKVEKIRSFNSSTHNNKVDRNRVLMKRFIDTIIVIAKQGLPILREHGNAGNRGNYVELLSYLREYDGILDAYMERCAKSSEFSGLSDEIRNDLIQCIASVVRDAIRLEISRVQFVTVMIEETPRERDGRMTVVLRYVTESGIEERFVGIYDVDSGADSLLNVLKEYECTKKLVGQCYPTLSGDFEVMQARLIQECSTAVVVPSHSFNTVLIRSLEKSTSYRDFFSNIHSVVRFFNRFPKCSKLLNEISGMSVTRWMYNSSIINLIYNWRSHMVQMWETMLDSNDSSEWDSDSLLLAEVLAKKLQDMQFCFLLHVFADIFEKTKLFDDLFKSKVTNFEDAMKETDSFKDWMSKDKEKIDAIYKNVCQYAKISSQHTNLNKKELKTEFYNKFVKITDDIPDHIYKICAKYTRMSYVELINRSKYAQYIENFPKTELETLASHYPRKFDFGFLKTELNVVYTSDSLKHLEPFDLYTHLRFSGLKEVFPNTFSLCDLSFTLPFVTSKCKERCYSTKERNRLITCLANTNVAEILNDFALISVENEFLCRLKNKFDFYENVLTHFIKRNHKFELEYIV